MFDISNAYDRMLELTQKTNTESRDYDDDKNGLFGRAAQREMEEEKKEANLGNMNGNIKGYFSSTSD